MAAQRRRTTKFALTKKTAYARRSRTDDTVNSVSDAGGETQTEKNARAAGVPMQYTSAAIAAVGFGRLLFSLLKHRSGQRISLPGLSVRSRATLHDSGKDRCFGYFLYFYAKILSFERDPNRVYYEMKENA